MSSHARTEAAADPFAALEGLLISYNALPEEDREVRWSGDADRITGEVARHLGSARTRLASTFDPPAVVRVEAEWPPLLPRRTLSSTCSPHPSCRVARTRP